jgi:hypothetical protein
LRTVTKELNKIKLERKKGKNIQKKVKKKKENKSYFKRIKKKNRKGAFEKVKKSFESSYKRIE